MSFGTSFVTAANLTFYDSGLCIVPYYSDELLKYFVYETNDLFSASTLNADSSSSYTTAYQTTPLSDTSRSASNDWVIDQANSVNVCS